jgi:DNA-binding HxlR family transcriptional regulator
VRNVAGDERAQTEQTKSSRLRIRTHRQWTPLARSLTATGDHWTMMIVAQLAFGAIRASDLGKRLPGISAGVLDDHLRQMTAQGLVIRRRFREIPPRVELELTDSGRELLPIAAALARWGVRRVWSSPRESERVDVNAVLRLLPILLDDHTAGLPDGVIEAVVTSHETRSLNLFQSSDGHLHHIEEAGRTVTALIEGDEEGWIAAFGPQGDYGKLRFKGDEHLILLILGAVSGRE